MGDVECAGWPKLRAAVEADIVDPTRQKVESRSVAPRSLAQALDRDVTQRTHVSPDRSLHLRCDRGVRAVLVDATRDTVTASHKFCADSGPLLWRCGKARHIVFATESTRLLCVLPSSMHIE